MVGVDRAVNAGFLSRLATVGGGRCELVESEDRLDEAMQAIHRRIGAPVAHSLALCPEGLATIEDTASPARIPDVFPGVPLVVTGRYRGSSTGSLALRGRTAEGGEWSAIVAGQRRQAPAVTAQWARGHLRDLEDRYAAVSGWRGSTTRTTWRSGSLHVVAVRCVVQVRLIRCRRSRASPVVAEGGLRHRVMQPVEVPAGWDAGVLSGAPPAARMVRVESAMMPPQPAPPANARSARTVKLRNVISGGGGQRVPHRWRLGVVAEPGEFLSSPLSDGVVAGKLPASEDASIPNATRAGVPQGTVSVPQAPAPPPRTPEDSTFKRDVVTTGSVQMVVAEPSQVGRPARSLGHRCRRAGWTRDRSAPDHPRRQ